MYYILNWPGSISGIASSDGQLGFRKRETATNTEKGREHDDRAGKLLFFKEKVMEQSMFIEKNEIKAHDNIFQVCEEL